MAGEKESLSIGKWFGGFINPVTWSKSLIYFIMVAILLFGGVTIYKAYFSKPQGNVNKPNTDNTVIMTPGTSVTGGIHQETKIETKQTTEEKKNKWWIPHLYSSVSAGGRIKSSGNSLDFGSAEPEIRADFLGLRWDWN